MKPTKALFFDEGTANRRYFIGTSRTSPSVQNHLEIAQENTSIGRIRLMIGAEENVNAKTFAYKDEKHGKGVQFGFVANDLLEELPDVFSRVVGEDKDGNYNINHIKLSVIFVRKSLQEQKRKDNKIEHLEARLFELEEIVKEMRGKGGEAKPKAKATSKTKNVD